MPSSVANVLILAVVLGFGVLQTLDPDLYYQQVQEDQPLEWVTFWAFIVAAIFFALAARHERQSGRLPWFLAGLAAFCFVVGMEEISWAQRVIGYQAPRYFLENNYQQELNLHNVVDTQFRKLAVALILAGYGILLPLLERIPSTRRLLERVGVSAPPSALSLGFALLLVVYVVYPWRYTGEVVEAGMGLAFMFSGLAALHARDGSEAGGLRQWTAMASGLSFVLVLGFGSAIWSRARLSSDPVVAQVAATEVHALASDVERLMRRSKRLCNRHERLTHFAERGGAERLRDGKFASMVGRGLPEERAEFFLDPWSTAYWIRTTCNEKRDKVYLYSFGPNRRRDSSKWKASGDDIGVLFRVRGSRSDKKRPIAKRDD